MAVWSDSDSRIWFASFARPLVRGDRAAAFTAALAAAAATCAATSFCLAACEFMSVRPGGSNTFCAGDCAEIGGDVEGVDADSTIVIPGNSYVGG